MKKYHRMYLALLFSFILGIHEGNIALWRSGEPTPLEVFPCRAEMLPPADQAALKKGIRVESPEHLSSLIEDYLS